MFSEQKKGCAVAIAPLTSLGANLQLCLESGVGVGAPRSGSIPLSQRLPRPGRVGSRTKGISGAERRGASLGWRRGGGAQLRGEGRGSEGPRVGKRRSTGGRAGGGARARGVSVREGPRAGRRQAGGGAMGGPRTRRPI